MSLLLQDVHARLLLVRVLPELCSEVVGANVVLRLITTKECSDNEQVDPDKAFAVQIAHEENVVTSSVSYIQCALLYTSSTGERRIRFVYWVLQNSCIYLYLC